MYMKDCKYRVKKRYITNIISYMNESSKQINKIYNFIHKENN